MSLPVKAEKVQNNQAARSPLARFGRKWGAQLGIVAVALVVWLTFLIAAPRTFLSGQIYQAFMQTTPLFAMMALPLTMVVIAGEMDLSFISVMAWGVAIYVIVLNATGSIFLGFIACLLAGLFAGIINGLLVVRIGMPSLVATIGTQFFWSGVVLVISNGKGASLVSAVGTPIYNIMVGRVGVVPGQMFWTIIIAAACWFFLNRTKAGGHVYLIGDNIDSARLMGVNVDARKIMVFAIVGVAAAFTGLTASYEVTYYWPTLGAGYLLQTLASVFLGGTSVFGGAGTIFGTFVASFVIGAINAGIVAAGLTGFWTQLIYGCIVVISVSIQTLLGKRLR